MNNAAQSLPDWIALMIGNSRLHWATFAGEDLQHTWDTPHLITAELPRALSQQIPRASTLPIYLASVVPQQTALWQAHPQVTVIQLEQLPLNQMYPSLGIDRALAVYGAGEIYGWPILVIDAGTALTLSGGNGDRAFVGGAILPGLSLQLRSLAQQTAALGEFVQAPEHPHLPDRWARDSVTAIHSGILHTLLAGIEDFIQAWQQQFPGSALVLTGGDRVVLHHCLSLRSPALAAQIQLDPHAIFGGIRAYRQQVEPH